MTGTMPMDVTRELTEMRYTQSFVSLLLTAGCAATLLEEGVVVPVTSVSIDACALECGAAPSVCAVWVDNRSAASLDACEASLPAVEPQQSLIVAEFGVRYDEDVEFCRAVYHAQGMELEFRVLRPESLSDTDVSERPYASDGWALVLPGAVSGSVIVQQLSDSCEETAARPDPEALALGGNSPQTGGD